MKKLNVPYRNTPSDAKCYYQNGNIQFFHSPHQQNLFLRHYAADHENLLSMRLICRTLAMPGDWHRRINPDFLNITYIHSGDTFVRINDESFLAEPGDLILLPPGCDYEFGSNKTAVRSGIVVQGKILASVLQNLHGKYIFSGTDMSGMESIINRFFSEQSVDEHDLAVWCFDLLLCLKNNNAQLLVPEVVYKVIQKMQKNLSEPLKLEQLAADSGVSPRTLSRLFIKYFQIPPHKYLVKLRMQRACQMLSLEGFVIKEIAASVGYSNALNFSTEFKRITGYSPSRFRLQGNADILQEKFHLLPIRSVLEDNEMI